MKARTIQLNAGGFNEQMVMIWATQVAPRQFADGNVKGVKTFMQSKYFQAYKNTPEGSKLLNKINEWLHAQASLPLQGEMPKAEEVNQKHTAP